MSRKAIWILTIISSIALIGLITIQIYWIKEAVDVKEKQFSQLVNKVMLQVVNKLETLETWNVALTLLNQEISNNDSTYSRKIADNLSAGFPGDGYSVGEENYLDEEGKNLNISTKIDLMTGTIVFLTKDSLQLDLSDPDNVKNLISRQELNERFKQIKKNIFIENIVENMVNYNIRIEDRITKTKIDSLLSGECFDMEIDLDYEFAVRDGEFNYVIQTENFKRNTNQEIFEMRLFPRDIIPTPSFLMVYFPNRSSYFFKSMSFISIYSIILTVSIILIFSITIFIIFKQKMLSEIKADFINNMTHELKTPISTISLASQMLTDKSLPKKEPLMQYISGIIDEESKRLGYQVEKVLQMSLFDKGKIDLKIKELNLNELIRVVVNTFFIQIEKEGGRLLTDLCEENIFIKADELHLTNVIYNLLDNAVKYCKNIPEITIGTKAVNNGVKIFVTDKGIGIGKESQSKVFDKFYRVPTGNLHDVRGFGLGLSYVKKIIEEHKGSITVSGEINKGSHFEIFLPSGNKK